MNESMQKVLKLIPLGVVILNKINRKISYANNEMISIIDKIEGLTNFDYLS